MKDILNVQHVQRQATKYILNDYISCYKTCLKLFPLMYLFDLQDILFAVKAIKTPTIQFNITNYIYFSYAIIIVVTGSGANNKLIPPHHLSNTSRHSYFTDCYLCRMLCLFDLNMSFCTLKSKLKSS